MPRDPATLTDLAAATGGRVVGDAATAVTDVHHDSRDVGPGELFVAISGFTRDGHDFAAAAAAQGAAVAVERELPGVATPQLVVADTRRALPVLAAAVHGHPSRRLAVVGVTGTDGKTTVTSLVDAIATASGRRSGLIGTMGASIAGEPVAVPRTTPEASDFQRLLARMVDAGVEVAAVEVSSHALELGRVDATEFAVAAFTNLTQDHLDFHGDLDRYFTAKASLFADGRAAHHVLWVDDPKGRELAERHRAAPTTTVSMHGPADIHAGPVDLDLRGAAFDLVIGADRVPVRLGLAGRYNVANALVAAGCAGALGISGPEIAAGLAALPRLAGRFDALPEEPGLPDVVVDYAHTPAAITATVAAAREVCSGRIAVVVGAGGDRDRAKRPLMGRAAAAADLVVVTSDNPRSEDPLAIVAAVADGARAAGGEPVVEPDRRLAIRRALSEFRAGDLVLVLGKGHEIGQEQGGEVAPFDDFAVAAEERSQR